MAQTAETPDFLELVSNAEGDMRKVYDHAFLLYDHLSNADPLTPDEQAALNWPAGDLLEAGRRLREHADAMYEAAILHRAAARPALATDGEPFIDPVALSIYEMFGLFDGLGTIGSILSGLMCQPRFRRGNGVLNPAGEMLERLQDLVDDMRDAIRLEALARKATSKEDLARQVRFAAEEWVDGACEPGPALKGLTTALTDLGKAVITK